MNDHGNAFRSVGAEDWRDAAALALRSPTSPVPCPNCHMNTLSAAWNVVDPVSREAALDLRCASCYATEHLRTTLPLDVLPCYPADRFAQTVKAMAKGLDSRLAQVREQVKAMPPARFVTNPLWEEARWSGTSYQWHSTSDAPPVMVLTFDNPEAGREIFRELVDKQGQEDQFEEVRISIIEGSPPGERDGYTMHIYPDPDALGMYAAGEGVTLDPNAVQFLSRWQRMYPIPGKTSMLLPRFKQELAKHKQFMVAPAVPRGGQSYADPAVGIIKHSIELRELSQITQPGDVDLPALMIPTLIPPRA